MKVPVASVRQLRTRTGAGVMDCRRALESSDGDLDRAARELRLSGMAEADGKAGRDASQGLVRAAVTERGDAAALLEVNCETDFVARGEVFRDFVESACRCVLRQRPPDLERLLALPLAEGAASVEEERRLLVAKVGEHIAVRRFALVEEARGHITSYLHGGGRIGVLVELEGGDRQVGRDLAMQIAWGRPRCLRREELPAEELRSACAASGAEEAETLAELVLLEQPFIKDSQWSVGRWLREQRAELRRMACFEVGRAPETPAPPPEGADGG